jgi:hypothetical protein
MSLYTRQISENFWRGDKPPDPDTRLPFIPELFNTAILLF